MVLKDKSGAIRSFLYDKVGFSGSFLIAFVILVFFFNSRIKHTEILSLNSYATLRFNKDDELSRVRNPNCSIFDCFNVYRCGNHESKASIYIYPLTEYSDADKQSKTFITKEFYQILKTIQNSPYYTPNPKEACLFVPSIDVLNQNLVDKNLVSKALASLP